MTTVDDDDLRARARRLLEQYPPATTEPVTFLRAQYDAGLAWLHYPPGFGGLGASIEQQPIVDDLLKAAGAPPSGRVTNRIGTGQCAATVLASGSEEQQHRYLPALFTGEEPWCQLFSEPGSGSDLASLATRATRDGDEWVVDGQKVWTSGAHLARHALLLARTDPVAEKHAGLTAFAIDLHVPGVEVRPLRQMNGGAEFSEVFLSGARIPDAERLGDVGAGWAVAHQTLVLERYNMPRIPGRGEGPIALAVTSWNRRTDKTSTVALAIKDRLMQHWVDAEVLRLLQARATSLRMVGGSGPEGSLGKLSTSVTGRRLGEFVVSLLGPEATLLDGYDVEPDLAGGLGLGGRVDAPYAAERSFVGSPATAIAGGTDQIQRSIIGDRVLGLPREPAADRGVSWNETLRN